MPVGRRKRKATVPRPTKSRKRGATLAERQAAQREQEELEDQQFAELEDQQAELLKRPRTSSTAKPQARNFHWQAPHWRCFVEVLDSCTDGGAAAAEELGLPWRQPHGSKAKAWQRIWQRLCEYDTDPRILATPEAARFAHMSQQGISIQRQWVSLKERHSNFESKKLFLSGVNVADHDMFEEKLNYLIIDEDLYEGVLC
eukprot:TRINITY_DN2260_c0_g1_i9.p1 TRINITY_DN2260_c0_g1~~TRINITY_DN2260_c0_g1_i9.p1  ORF type:complete len:233 (-),score=38.12 TRINITY_DN2260_c0_g1_i9:651-1250(-)